MVILSSGRAVKDILDKNGLLTSDRFQPYALLHAEGIYQIFDHASSHRWKAMRKATHTFLAPEALQGYWVVQQTEYLRLLRDVIDSPKDIYTHIKRTTASVMTTLIYGKSIPHYAGSKAELFFEGTKCLNELAAPFDHPPLDFFPAFRRVPERWARWKTLSRKTKQIRNAFDQDLFPQCEDAVQSGKRTGCYLENVIEAQAELGLNRDEVRPIVPAGVPHVASRDTQYNGFVIPRGSIIFMNTWGIYHNPEFFDDPDSFKPERYLLSEFGTKPGASTEGLRDSLPFGAGRRICPGAEMASRNIAMNAINLLWAFNFSKDASGTCTMDLENYLPGMEFALKQFTCNIEVRSEARASLIKRACDAAAL
ncbi:hypothetical protein EYR40_004258 [Pleurotus pulmonarius]|nr:hypothetical protein EYR40_004258 [Pleurotus pulmonarius]